MQTVLWFIKKILYILWILFVIFFIIWLLTWKNDNNSQIIENPSKPTTSFWTSLKDSWLYIDQWFSKLKLKDYQWGLLDFNKALEIDPNNADAYQWRWAVKQTLKDYQWALLDLNKVIELDPNNSDAIDAKNKLKSLLK